MSGTQWIPLGAAATVLTLAGVAGTTAVPLKGNNAEAAALKPVVGGLLDRQGFPRSSHTDALRAFVVEPRWADVQPTVGSFHTAEIDRELAQAKAAGMRVKLRVLSGVHAPDWVKNAAGSMVWYGIGQQTEGQRMTAPPLVDHAVPERLRCAAGPPRRPLRRRSVIGQNVMCGPTGEFCEPFLRDAADHRNRTALLRAGYTLVHLLGRRLYETMLYWETADQDPSLDDPMLEWAAIWKPLPKVVFSTTLSAVQGNARPASGGLAEEIERLRAEPGAGDIAIGGATLAAEPGSVDRVRG